MQGSNSEKGHCGFTKTHMMTRTPTYYSWAAMRGRCLDQRHKAYKNYGGRGIRICQFLMATPQNLAACIGERPEGLTLDRSNNDGHYSCGSCEECKAKGWPLNVKWSPKSDQVRNMRRNKWITFNGVTKCVMDWAVSTGIPYKRLESRIRLGWPVEQLFLPTQTNSSRDRAR